MAPNHGFHREQAKNGIRIKRDWGLRTTVNEAEATFQIRLEYVSPSPLAGKKVAHICAKRVFAITPNMRIGNYICHQSATNRVVSTRWTKREYSTAQPDSVQGYAQIARWNYSNTNQTKRFRLLARTTSSWSSRSRACCAKTRSENLNFWSIFLQGRF